MLYIGISFYCLSLLAQFAVAVVSVSIIKSSKSFRLGWLLLGIAFVLMLGRRISPILFALNSGEVNMVDAVLSALISNCLLFGAVSLKGSLDETEELNQKLTQSTKIDYLTHALSRQETFQRAKYEIARSARTKRPIALLSVDVDHFKRINDSFGHLIGDQVLKGMVGFIISKIRSIDFIGRIGGEEFLIVLPESNEAEAMEVAERLREGLSEFTCCMHCDQEIKITVSIGIAIILLEKEYEDYAKTLETYLDRADMAMYEAKKNGRNQCRLSR